MLLDTWKIRRTGWFALANYTACRPYPYQLNPCASGSEANKPNILKMTEDELYEELYFHNGQPEHVIPWEPKSKRDVKPPHPCIGVPESVARIGSLLQLRARVQMAINERRELAEKNYPPPPPQPVAAADDDQDDNDNQNPYGTWGSHEEYENLDQSGHQNNSTPSRTARQSRLSIPLRSSRPSAGPSRRPWRP